MQQEIDNYISAGQASFSAMLNDFFYSWKQITLSLRRFGYKITIHHSQLILKDVTYSQDLLIEIPSGLTTECTLRLLDIYSHMFRFDDYRTRDTFVLTMRTFKSKSF